MTNMRYFIVDDDIAVRSMIAEIIEDNDLGHIVGEASDGTQIDASILYGKQVDILLIDLLMPLRDGLETIKTFQDSYDGKIVMISQVSSKDMIGEAYGLGVEYYITKPVNRLELIGVLKKVGKQVHLQRSITDIHKTLNNLGMGIKMETGFAKDGHNATLITKPGQHLLTELGVIGTTGSKDLLDLLTYLHEQNRQNPFNNEFPSLKDIFEGVALKKTGLNAVPSDVKKEVKAAEQRVRRSIYQALSHLASIGLTDYTHPKFEEYASTFFNFSEVRNRMQELKQNTLGTASQSSINTKKFVKVLYLESCKRL